MCRNMAGCGYISWSREEKIKCKIINVECKSGRSIYSFIEICLREQNLPYDVSG